MLLFFVGPTEKVLQVRNDLLTRRASHVFLLGLFTSFDPVADAGTASIMLTGL